MILLLCVSDGYFLTAARAVPLRVLLMVAGSVSSFILMVITLTVNHFADGRGGVNTLLMGKAWLIAVYMCSSGGSDASLRDRSVSITYETLGTGGCFSGEDFQNTETFIVVRSSVFVKSSAKKTHLARDAHKRIMGSGVGVSRGNVRAPENLEGSRFYTT
ncbi:hypothetical protein [uncultured Gimesia sp.]|uniref:hypothetical protein n=1 Tax=uncultured Gimesia sp. TaxID=1678688 RepID=UPI002601D9A2|nr:hypothetical protein [uncultured Gimesia sp.]